MNPIAEQRGLGGAANPAIERIVGVSPWSQQVRRSIELVAAHQSSVLIMGPSGARLSVDALLAGPGQGRGEPSVRTNVALRLLQVHLCVVYFFSGAGKLFGASWWEGTALWGAIANDRYRTLDLRWLAGHPLVVNALTLATLWWEVGYAALVWPRLTRRLCLAMAVLVHLGIGLAMGMMEFGLAMITANLAFVPAATVARLLAPFTSRSPSLSSTGTISDHP